jgi:hypothetical protein
MDEEPTNNSNGIVDPVEPDPAVPTPEDASPAAGETAPGTTSKEATGLTSEKVLDIALGVAIIAGEALDKAAQRLSERAKELQEQSPTFWDTAEERGRPVREKLVSTLKGSSGATSAGTEPGGTGLADSLRTLGRDIGITVAGGSTSRLSAEDEIRSLEDRVRELEQVVVSGKTGAEPDIPELTETAEGSPTGEPVKSEAPLSESLDDNSAQSADVSTASNVSTVSEEVGSAPTTAESFSYAFGEDQHEDFLAASPYAVSETDDERAVEASGSMNAVEAIPQGEAAPPEGDVTPPASNPGATGRSSRKKQRDFDPEATDDNSPSSPEE